MCHYSKLVLQRETVKLRWSKSKMIHGILQHFKVFRTYGGIIISGADGEDFCSRYGCLQDRHVISDLVKPWTDYITSHVDGYYSR